MDKISIKSLCWLYQIYYGGVENRAYNMAAFLSRFANVEFLFARPFISDNTFQRFFPKKVKIRVHKIAPFLLKFADIEFLFARPIYSNTSYQNKANLRYRPIQIYFNPYKVYRKDFWEDFFIKKATMYLNREKQNIDLVIGHGLNAIPGINVGLPTVTTMHGVDRWISNPPKLRKILLRKSNKIIAITKRVQSQLIEKGVDEKKISVIYNGVDFNDIDNTKLKSKDFLEKYGINPDKRIILSVHNFNKVKNTMRIIQSFINIKRGYDDYQLVFIGDGPEKRYYVNYIKRKKIKDVYFIGKLFKTDLYPFYKVADVFLMPSLRESWGIVFFEAMAAKCAVILSKNCGVTEIIENNKDGIIVDPNSQPEIDNALKTLIDDDEFKKQLGENGYKLARTLDWENQGKILWKELQEFFN
ncbi:glycosyltransferase family 4 protein [Candidatus Borrarchaeum sp.]|uniref:glycosyltransferase family 4 protein n=1 Tax=Candidatus Borrarchaeum sp. TaxID=2846742 RepID=UPI00257B2667|nr:glycosyltransferase family 4 protein [Candidatus Borrarchaeum sp.]